KREDNFAAIKFWVNGKDEFKTKFQKLPAETNSDSLFEEISKILETSPTIVFHRNTINTILTKIEFEIQLEEEKPFLKILFDVLQTQFNTSKISIDKISHQNYRERYFISKSEEKAVIDFEYNGDGFFGRVLPLENKCSSNDLLNEIKKAVLNIKKFENVV
ncbi:MAG: hypothetical protein DRP35_11595, partial [Candidatus Zixiibacteriota bacterium]